MSPRSIFWISGWSIPAGWLLELARDVWPAADHDGADPGPGSLDRALASSADALGGFSLGAHLLLRAADPRPRILLAPFVDLKREAALGGAVATTQIRHLARWLRRDRAAALADFHARIGLDDAPDCSGLSGEDLAWGLEQMLAAGPAPGHLPEGSAVLAGKSDPLLDPDALARALPMTRFLGVGHQPQPLLAAAARLGQSGAP